MRREFLVVKAAAALVVAGLAGACGGSEPAKQAEAPKIIPQEVGEMSPEEAGGMAPTEEAAGSAANAAPHGGTVVPLGSAASLELVLDPSSGLLTGYVLDATGTKTMRVAAKAIALQVTPAGGRPAALSLAATANGLTGDTVGNSAQFGGTLPALKGVTAFSGVVKSFTAGGATVTDVAFTYPAH